MIHMDLWINIGTLLYIIYIKNRLAPSAGLKSMGALASKHYALTPSNSYIWASGNSLSE